MGDKTNDKSIKEQSNPFSTGGGGVNFETRVQAVFAVQMLTGRTSPCLPSWPIYKMKLQGRYDGYQTDDFTLFAKDRKTGTEAKLLAQIKHSISFTNANETLGNVFQSAWNDFTNSDIFDKKNDAIALITGPLSAHDIKNVRPLLEWARHSEDEKDFFSKVKLEKFSSDAKRDKLDVLRFHLKMANDETELSDKQLWEFLKVYHLIGYDLDTDSSTTLSLVKSLIGQNSESDSSNLWSRIIEVVQSCNQNAGTLTINMFPSDIMSGLNTKLNRNWVTDLEKLKDHSQYILEGIQSTIGDVYVRRPSLIKQLLQLIEESSLIFISGGRGSGKSSLVREFTEFIKGRAPTFCFRTEDFDKGHLDHVFSAIGITSSLSQLEAGFSLWNKKYLIIESLEKLLEMKNTSAFIDLINFVRKHPGWTIIATGRDYSYQQLAFSIIQPTGINCATLVVPDFNNEEIHFLLENIDELRTFKNNNSIKFMLKNPFFANLAYRVSNAGAEFSKSDGEEEFRKAVWRVVIAKEEDRAEGMPLKRKNPFVNVSVKRAKNLVYGVPENEFDSIAVLKLEEDNLIRRDSSNGLISPAHDVLEDWALEQYIEDAYRRSNGKIHSFLNSVGHEPAMNRAFRLWLHQKLRTGKNVKQLIVDIVKNNSIENIWKDEAISAVLIGEQPYEFLMALSDQLINEDDDLIKRFCFLLRLSCKTPHMNLMKEFTGEEALSNLPLFLIPFGGGWEAMTRFLYEQRTHLSEGLIPHVINVLHDWSSLVHIDKSLPNSAREVGLLSLYLLATLNDSYGEGEGRKKLLSVIVKVVPLIHDEFNELVEREILARGDKKGNPSYLEDLCTVFLVDLDSAFLCKNEPDITIKLALHRWLIEFSPEDRYPYGGERLEECFGIHSYRSESRYFPASGAKGPFHSLLRYHPRKGLDFIIELLNRSAQVYAYSDLESPSRHGIHSTRVNNEPKQIKIPLSDGTYVNQYYSGRLWQAYRGHSVVPYLLQSALMALENWLVNIVEYSLPMTSFDWIFEYILRTSNSVMPTAILASLATGYPEQLGKNAYPLLRTPELYDLDLARSLQEQGRQELNWFKTGINQDPLADYYTNERKEAALRHWRREHLETLITRLQFTEIKSEITEIIDELRSKVSNDESWRFRFHRIDSRDWEPVVNEEKNQITFVPKNIESDLIDIQEESQEQETINNRYVTLLLWSDKLLKREILEREYYADWRDALTEARNLLELLGNVPQDIIRPLYFGSIVRAAALFLREHSAEMSEDELAWCFKLAIDVILSSANTEDSLLLDGTPEFAEVLPFLLDYNKDQLLFKKIIATALTHTNKSVRISVANGIRKHLWTRDANFSQNCLNGAIEYARKTKENVLKNRKVIFEGEDFYEEDTSAINASKNWLEKLRDQISKDHIKIDIEKISFKTHSSWHVLTPSLMVPASFPKKEHFLFMSRLLLLIFEAEESENNYGHRDEMRNDIDYELPFNFSKHFGEFFLGLSVSNQDQYLEVLQSGCSQAPNFIQLFVLQVEVISEQQGDNQLYWRLWSKFSKQVQELSIASSNKDPRYFDGNKTSKLIRRMLNTDTPWQKVQFENEHMLAGKDLILEFVTKAGMNIDVFEGMSSLMYHFPKIYLEPGLMILSRHQKEVGGMKLFSGVNTAFYLEHSIQRFLLNSNGPIPRELHLSCWVLLDAIIETASSVAYFLREHLIRSRRIEN